MYYLCIVKLKQITIQPSTSSVKSDIMKAIQIKFEGIETPMFSTIKNEDKFEFCTVSEKAANYIKAQSVDGIVYDGADYYNGFGGVCADLEPCKDIFCRSNGDVSSYYVKANVYDEKDPFAPAKEGEWQWQRVEIRTIDIMD